MSEAGTVAAPVAGVERLMQRIGLDRAIFFTLLGRFWNSIANVVSIAVITRFLSIEEQGYYYTFGSVIGLQVFFELGLAFVIMQSSSHERATLTWNAEGLLEGGRTHRARLSSLLRLAATYYTVISAMFAVCAIPAGIYFFATQKGGAAGVSWTAQWIWLVLATAGTLNLSPHLAFIEGCGQVDEVALVRVKQGIAGTACFWAALALGMKLYALPVMTTVSLGVGLYWLLVKKRRFLLHVWRDYLPGQRINWWSEIWPFQWRIALSWLAGYFIFQLFTPVLFRFHGAAAAGSMGMSITLTGAVSSVALAWVTTKSPAFGSLAALRQITSLDRLFFRAFWQAVFISAFFCCVLVGGVALLNVAQVPFAARLLKPLPFALLSAAAFINVIISAEAIYLRSFREEPFLVVSLLNGLFIGASTYLLGRYFGVAAMMAGYLGVNIVVGLGMGTWVLHKKRKLWHQQFPHSA